MPRIALTLAALALALGTVPLPAQDKKADAPDEKAELAEFLDDAKAYVVRTAKPDAALKLNETPVLNFTNPERNQERGSVFVWLTDDGRPAVMGQFFRYNTGGRRPKKHALHSLATGPLEAKFRDKLAWAPETPGVEWKAVPDAPAVAAAPKERLIQMRQLIRPFKLSLIDPKDSATELRLAPRPLYEYTAPKAGVTSGAIFSYVVATDPEAILIVESFDESGKTGFRYALARFHYFRLTATLNDKPVWDVAYDAAMPRNTFGNPDALKKVYNSFHP